MRWGHRFVDIYTFRDEGEVTADYGRLHETEPFVPNESLHADRLANFRQQ